MDDVDKIEAILLWAEDNDSFDTAFVESLQEQLEDKGELTEKQSSALDNIIEKWSIPT